MAASHRAVDFLWIALAALGLLRIVAARNRVAAAAAARHRLCARRGILLGGLYRIRTQGRAALGGRSAALGTVVGAAAIVPIGAAHAGAALAAPAILPAACAVAVLSSALPYSLEMYALTRMPTRTFGVLMSLEPALGALSGLCFLGESLTAVQWAAIACIMLGSGGSAATSRPSWPPPLAGLSSCGAALQPTKMIARYSTAAPASGHGGGEEFRMGVIALRDQIARADVEKEAGEQRERDAELIAAQAQHEGRGDAQHRRRGIEQQPAKAPVSDPRDSSIRYSSC